MSQLLRAGLVSGFTVALFLIFVGEADLFAQEIDLPWVRVEAGTFEMGCVPRRPVLSGDRTSTPRSYLVSV